MSHILMLGPDHMRDGDVVRMSWLDDARVRLREMLAEIATCPDDSWMWTIPVPGEPPLLVDCQLDDGTIYQHACIDAGGEHDLLLVKLTRIAPAEAIERIRDGAPEDGAVGVSVNVNDTSLEIAMQPVVMMTPVLGPVERLRREAECRATLGERP